jgi:hypothetical protein
MSNGLSRTNDSSTRGMVMERPDLHFCNDETAAASRWQQVAPLRLEKVTAAATLQPMDTAGSTDQVFWKTDHVGTISSKDFYPDSSANRRRERSDLVHNNLERARFDIVRYDN